jgi:two-component system, chemotaxis family, CheB/CheR fusion protein
VVATLVEPADAHAVERVVSSVAAAVETRIDLRGEALHLSASIGVAAYPGDGDDIDQLLHRADEQMYRVKRSGKGQVSMTEGCLGIDQAS